MLPSRQEFRSILHQTLEDEDPKLLRTWQKSGEANAILDEQVNQAISVLKWNLGPDPYNHPDLAKCEQAKELALERLLDYPGKQTPMGDPFDARDPVSPPARG